MPKRGLSTLFFALVLASFLVPFIFSSVLQRPRAVYLLRYVALVGALGIACLVTAGFGIKAVTTNWIAGLIVAGVISFLAITNLAAYPSSPAPRGLPLYGFLLWLGLVYGTVDALLLCVVPIVVTRRLVPARFGAWGVWLIHPALALVVSFAITLIYHSG